MKKLKFLVNNFKKVLFAISIVSIFNVSSVSAISIYPNINDLYDRVSFIVCNVGSYIGFYGDNCNKQTLSIQVQFISILALAQQSIIPKLALAQQLGLIIIV